MMFRKVDCIELFVPDLESGLDFYCNRLGHTLLWRTDQSAGVGLPESEAEIVLQTERKRQEVDFTVESADRAAVDFSQAGGKIIADPFDIQIGRCTVVQDPWGNRLVLLDTSKGRFATDESGNVIGVIKA